jgi:hypothetical protein
MRWFLVLVSGATPMVAWSSSDDGDSAAEGEL